MNFRKLAVRKRTPRLGVTDTMYYLPLAEWERHKDLIARVVGADLWSDITVLYHTTRNPPSSRSRPPRISMRQ